MEALLSLAFDNLSFDGPKVRKGLRQVEGLLAHICLSDPTPSRRSERRDSEEIPSVEDGAAAHLASPDGAAETPASPRRKKLGQLAQDPAFREFFKLQEGFEWNVALRLLDTLDRLMAKGSEGQNDLILNALDLIQGLMLLHPPSKALFSREQNMNLLLDLLEPCSCPAIQSATLLTLVVALLEAPANTRTFEGLDGLLTVTSLFKSRSTRREVKLKLVEFLYCYLMPESAAFDYADLRGSVLSTLQRRSSRRQGETKHKRTSAVGYGALTLSTEDKQELLSRHLSNVEDLVRDMQNCAPFGGAVC